MDILEAKIDIDDLDDFLKEINSIEKENNTIIQGFDPSYIISPRHLKESTKKAKRSIQRNEQIADEVSMEIMLYAAGTRQIEKALEIGLKPSKNEAVFIIENSRKARNDLKKKVQEDTIKYGGKVKDFFNITKKELNTVGKDKIELLVLERVALLDITKWVFPVYT